MLLLAAASCLPASTAARGLHYEPAPWYAAAFADSHLSLAVGTTYAESDTQRATLFPLTLATLRRGPFEFAGRWSYVVLGNPNQHVFGFGDVKLFGRYRFPVFRDTLNVQERPNFWVEFDARIQISDPEFFPYATGGQDLELLGVFGWPRAAALLVGVGRIWTERPGNSQLRRQDLPHATHLWLQLGWVRRNLVFELRGDGFVFEVKDTARGVVTSRITRRNSDGFHIGLEVGFESSAPHERVFNQFVSLRFAARLR